MTPADAIKAVREALASFKSAATGSSFDVEQIRRERFAFMRTALEHLPAILARAEAFERIRGLYRTPSWQHVEGVADIIDEVEAAEKADGT